MYYYTFNLCVNNRFSIVCHKYLVKKDLRLNHSSTHILTYILNYNNLLKMFEITGLVKFDIKI